MTSHCVKSKAHITKKYSVKLILHYGLDQH